VATSNREEQRERFRELLEELRVVIPGTEVLLAFLLTAPFSQRFTELQPDERAVYGLALVSTAVATILLVAPTVYHRFGRHQGREARLRVSVVLSMAGVFALGVGIVAAVHVVVGFVWGDVPGNWATALLAGAVVLLWYGLPLLRTSRNA
jgi:hypothetical protein